MRISVQLPQLISCSFLHVLHKKHVLQLLLVLFLFISVALNPIVLSVNISRNPEITILNPISGESYSDTVHIQWRVTDFDQGMRMYMYYKNTKETFWMRINDETILEDTEYLWSTSALEDGYYQLLVELVTSSNYVIHEKSDEFLIDNDNTDLYISEIRVRNMESSLYTAVKNGAGIQITAMIQHDVTVNLLDIYADLQALGEGNQVYPDSFDGNHAVWNISSVQCSVSDGFVQISICVLDIEQKNASIQVDNTKPHIEILKPAHGLYLFNKNMFPLLPSKSIVIGDIELHLEVYDESSIVQTNIFVDNTLQHTFNGELADWWLKSRIFGTHLIRVVMTDSAGNKAESSTICIFVNFF